MTILNWEFIQQYLPLYEKAAWLTLRLGVMGILLSIAVGLACAVIQYEKIPVLRRVVAVYIEISRNTPLLIQLFFLYYGLPKIGIRTSPAMCGVAGLAFLGGSYMAEAFRSGLEAVEPIQRESAFSLGMTRTQAMALSLIHIEMCIRDRCGAAGLAHLCLHGGGGIFPHPQLSKICAAAAAVCGAV